MTGVAREVGNRGKRANRFGRGRGRPDVPDSPFGERVQQWILRHSLEHLHGPEEVDYGVDEFVVLVQLYNGKPYVKPLLEHYFSMGARHVFSRQRVHRRLRGDPQRPRQRLRVPDGAPLQGVQRRDKAPSYRAFR